MSAAHTAGPWETEANENGDCHVMSSDGTAIADMACDYSGIELLSEHEANARLIAAAPDMIYSLKEFIALVDMGVNPVTGGDGYVVQKARAAISKATGEAS
jgi:hypothetical protein